YVCGCFGGLCPSCHVGLLGRNGNQRVWSTHVRIRGAKLSGIWRHVWSWVDSHRRGVILHVLRVLLGNLIPACLHSTALGGNYRCNCGTSWRGRAGYHERWVGNRWYVVYAPNCLQLGGMGLTSRDSTWWGQLLTDP